MDATSVYVPLLVGWALGLVTPHVTDFIVRSRRRGELKRGIILELQELRVTLATAAWILFCKTAELDVKFMRWYLPIALSGSQTPADALPREAMNRLSEKPDSALQADVDSFVEQSRAKGLGLNSKKYDAPFLTAHQAELTMFDHSFQRSALHVRSFLSLFNSDVELVRDLSLKALAGC